MENTVNEYEIMLLLSPSLSETEVGEYMERFKKEKLDPIHAKVSFEDLWGKRTLAYPIKKETSATYLVLVFTVTGDSISGLDEEIRLDKNIIRHLITRTEKNVPTQKWNDFSEWNKENLPEKKKSNQPEEKRVPLRSRKPVPKRIGEDEILTPINESEKKPSPKDVKLDKAQLDKKLDEILDGDLDL